MGSCSDVIMAASTFKKLQSKMMIAADYAKLHVRDYEAIALSPDATEKKFTRPGGDVVVVTFD